MTTGLSKWTINSGNVDYHSGLLEDQNDFLGAAGRQSVDMNGDSPGRISQVVKIKPGRTYQIRYRIAGAEFNQPVSGCGATGAEAVKHRSVFFHPTIATSSPAVANVTFNSRRDAFTNMRWRYDVITVPTHATDPTQWTLSFASGNSGFCGAALDGVALVAQ
jgi:hypothetical protein